MKQILVESFSLDDFDNNVEDSYIHKDEFRMTNGLIEDFLINRFEKFSDEPLDDVEL